MDEINHNFTIDEISEYMHLLPAPFFENPILYYTNAYRSIWILIEIKNEYIHSILPEGDFPEDEQEEYRSQLETFNTFLSCLLEINNMLQDIEIEPELKEIFGELHERVSNYYHDRKYEFEQEYDNAIENTLHPPSGYE